MALRRAIVLCLLVASCHAREAHPDAASAANNDESLAVPAASASEAPAPPASAEGAFYEPEPDGRPTVILRAGAPTVQYAALDGASCLAELGKRSIAFSPGEATKGVLAPVRIHGLLHGVSVHSILAPTDRDRSSSTIFDCRLVLAMDDFAAVAAAHDIVEIIYLGAYRPQSAFGCTPKYAGMQHCAALAVDVATFKKKDGTVLSVEKDFHGHVGSSTCGPTAHPTTPTAAATQLWSLVCETADKGIFNVMLTPNYNAQHFNHVHVEVTPNAGWMLIH